MMVYTKEPWEFFTSDDGLVGVKMGNTHEVAWDIEGACAECFGNMRLVAAAPDLLEACQIIPKATVESAEEYIIISLTHEEWHQIRKAITKATREEAQQ